MTFLVKLYTTHKELPVNYQYPLSAAIYTILNGADEKYAAFLHQRGYGKGFKLFCFSHLHGNFKLQDDRLLLQGRFTEFKISFYLPEASQNFIKGLFLSQQIQIADKKSKAVFSVTSVEALPNPFAHFKENEMVQVQLKPLSPVVAGIQNEKGMYKYLSPEDPQFAEIIIYNWRSKLETCFDASTASVALLLAEIVWMPMPPKSKLVTIKEGTPQETKIRGWMNMGIKVTAERRFVDLLLDCGTGSNNAQGMGYVEVVAH